MPTALLKLYAEICTYISTAWFYFTTAYQPSHGQPQGAIVENQIVTWSNKKGLFNCTALSA